MYYLNFGDYKIIGSSSEILESVEVNELMGIEKYSHVMHIVSNVEGKIRKGNDEYDVLRAGFSAGIVADSVGEREYQETFNKAKALMEAVEIAERGLD